MNHQAGIGTLIIRPLIFNRSHIHDCKCSVYLFLVRMTHRFPQNGQAIKLSSITILTLSLLNVVRLQYRFFVFCFFCFVFFKSSIFSSTLNLNVSPSSGHQWLAAITPIQPLTRLHQGLLAKTGGTAETKMMSHPLWILTVHKESWPGPDALWRFTR